MPPLDFPASPTTGQVFQGGNGSWTWDSQKWVSGNGVGFLAIISDTPPLSVAPGTLWWNSSPGVGQLYCYFNDGTSSQWVAANNPGASNQYLPLTGGQLNPGGLLIGTAGTVPGTGSLLLNANTVAPPAPPATPNLTINGTDALYASIHMDGYGGQGTVLRGRAARGTNPSPTASQSGDVFINIVGQGRGATAYAGGSYIAIQAAQNWTDAAQGTQISFSTTPNGGTGGVNSLILQGNTAIFSGSLTTADTIQVQTSGGTDARLNLNTSNRAWQIVNQQSTGTLFLWDISAGAARFQIDTGGHAACLHTGSTGFTVNGPNNQDCYIGMQGGRNWLIGPQYGTASFIMWDGTGGGTRISIDASGNCKNTSGTWSALSDSRAKLNVESYTIGLDAILALDPIRYDLATDDWQGEGLVGFAAEQVTAVLPELCGTAITRLKGKNTELMTVAPTGVVFALVNAVKELKAELDELKARL